MQSKRDELIPVGKIIGSLSGPRRFREASPQALHHFTQTDPGEPSLSRPAKRTPISASWRGRWRCAPCPAPTPATAFNTSDRTAPTRST